MTCRNPEILIHGERHQLKLTLGALAAIEASVGGGDFESLKKRLEAPRVSDLVLILHALIAGGGKDLAIEALRASDVDLSAASAAIADAFKVIAEPPQAEHTEKAAPGKPAGEQASPGATGLYTR